MNREPLFTPAFTLSWVANLVQGMTFTLFVHLPGFLDDLGADEVEIGMIFAATAVASIAIRPWIGSVMDRRGRRVVIVTGNLLNVGVIALYLTITALGPWVYTVRILHGFAAALLFTALFTYAADRVPAARRTQGLALFGVSGMLPIALGGVLGDVILERWDFDALFLTALGLAVGSLVLSLPLRDVAAPDLTAVSPHFRDTLGRPGLMPLWWISAIFSLVLAAYFTFLKTFTLEVGFGSVGGFFTAYAGVAIALRLAAGWLPDRVGQKRVLYPALGVLAAGFVVLAGAESGRDVIVAGALCGLGHGYAFPILYAMTVARTPVADRGTAMAIFTSLFDVGVLVGGPLFGLAISIGDYPSMFLTAGAMLAAGTLVFAWWDRRVVQPVPA